jgi:hypothetical protein
MKGLKKAFCALSVLSIAALSGCSIVLEHYFPTPKIENYQDRSVLWKDTHHAVIYEILGGRYEGEIMEFQTVFFKTVFPPINGFIRLAGRYPSDWSDISRASLAVDRPNFILYADNDFLKDKERLTKSLEHYFPDYKNHISKVENDRFTAEIINFPADKCGAAIALTSLKGENRVQTVDFLIQNKAPGNCTLLKTWISNYESLTAGIQSGKTPFKEIPPFCSSIPQSHMTKTAVVTDRNWMQDDRPDGWYFYSDGYCVSETYAVTHFYWQTAKNKADTARRKAEEKILEKEAHQEYLRRRAKDPLYDFMMTDKHGRTIRCGRESPDLPILCND